MSRKVLIAGAGQLGSRYLQGLSSLEELLDIYVFDISAESLMRAEQRWNEMHAAVDHQVRYVRSLTALPTNIDLAIIATTADVRTELVAEITKQIDIKYWVLEKVLAQSTGEIRELQMLLGNDRSAWVNTPMHLWPLYRKIRALYPVRTIIDARFEGFRGLVCNAIHYVDFISRWNYAPLTEVKVAGLQCEWYPAKRDGFYEIDGEILLRFADGSSLSLASDRKNLDYKVKLKIAGDEWQVSEVDGIARAIDGREVEGSVKLQSELAAPLIKAIFAGASCGLPTLAESAQQHALLLNALLEHWNRHMPDKVERLPIT